MSVSPISTCFASLVTVHSTNPRRSRPSTAISGRLDETVDAGRAEPFLDGGHDPVDLGLRRVVPLGSGRRSIFRRLSRCETIRASMPRAAQPGDGVGRRSRQRRVFGGGGGSPGDDAADRLVDLEELGPAIQREEQATRTGRPGLELTVDVVDVRSADDGDVDRGRRTAVPPAPGSRRASARRSGTAVPSQSKTIASKRRATPVSCRDESGGRSFT